MVILCCTIMFQVKCVCRTMLMTRSLTTTRIQKRIRRERCPHTEFVCYLKMKIMSSGCLIWGSVCLKTEFIYFRLPSSLSLYFLLPFLARRQNIYQGQRVNFCRKTKRMKSIFLALKGHKYLSLPRSRFSSSLQGGMVKILWRMR